MGTSTITGRGAGGATGAQAQRGRERGRRKKRRAGCETHHGFRASPVSTQRRMRRSAPVRTFRAASNGRRLFFSSSKVLTGPLGPHPVFSSRREVRNLREVSVALFFSLLTICSAPLP